METLVTENWPDYTLIDTGNRKRLEQFGGYFVVRSEPTALWEPTQPENPHWHQPDALFLGDKHQPWKFAQTLPVENWKITWESLAFKIKPSPFRHMGIFPEQAVQWQWIKQTIEEYRQKHGKAPKVLNLFGYTGAASLVAAQAGAEVVHVDAAKNTVQFASENAQLNHLGVRWIVDDALKFMYREARRGSTYNLIIMDPPVFGRGPKGEIWRLTEQLLSLAEATADLLSDKDAKLLLNFYATELYPEAVARTVASVLEPKIGSLTLASLCLREEISKKVFQTGYSLRS
jgi:23S rRNA (cytosine1962-C5)-methyltransferase